jgi:hypothetical protein
MSRKGIAAPGRPIPIPALTEKDIADGHFALKHGVDYIALSFVQRAADVVMAREAFGAGIPIISKIEKPAALDDLEGIVQHSDAVMVARGDLGVELSPEQVPIAQRRIIRVARAHGKPVIVATHLLESMVEALVPTRAEANDVALTLDGADRLGDPLPHVDVLLLGDMTYDPEMSARVLAWASSLTARGATVLLGDPGRGNLDGAPLRLLARYPVLVNDPSLPRCERETSVFAVVG